MPLYAYACPQCDALFEERRTIAAADEPVVCPVCKASAHRELTTCVVAVRSQAQPILQRNAAAVSHAAGCACCRPFV